MCTWTTDRAPVTAATWACRPASADGRTGSIPGTCTASPWPSTTATSSGRNSPLSRPLAVTASNSGSRAQHFGQVARRRPHPAQRAETGRLGRQAGADGEQLLAVRHGHGSTSAKEPTTGCGAEVPCLGRLAGAPHADRPPSGRDRRVELGGHVRQEQRRGRRDAERRGDRGVGAAVALGAGVHRVEVGDDQPAQISGICVREPCSLAGDRPRRVDGDGDTVGVPGAEPRGDVSEDVGGQLARREAGRPDLTLQGLERGGLEVGVHPGVQHGDDVGGRRAGCEPGVGDRRGDGRGHLLVAGVGLDPRPEPGPGVVVEVDVDRGSRTRGAFDVDDDRPGRHAK